MGCVRKTGRETQARADAALGEWESISYNMNINYIRDKNRRGYQWTIWIIIIYKWEGLVVEVVIVALRMGWFAVALCCAFGVNLNSGFEPKCILLWIEIW